VDKREVIQAYSTLGGEFITPPETLAGRLDSIHAFLFDWDGVFNAGTKGEKSSSTFSEADSMGINLLRFGYWLTHGRLPFVAIMTGENNPSAVQLAEREHFTAIYYQTRDKGSALTHLERTFDIKAECVAFCYDDVLDLAVAARTGLGFRINRLGSPLFARYAGTKNFCDYVTANSGMQNGVREVCELILGLTGRFINVVEKRCAFDDDYRRYLEVRNALETQRYTYSQGVGDIIAV
jgi:3-deoxy-D-manno-octulosonate 8-phosphate phosphatase (KDO 8-P phosphatase)